MINAFPQGAGGVVEWENDTEKQCDLIGEIDKQVCERLLKGSCRIGALGYGHRSGRVG